MLRSHGIDNMIKQLMTATTTTTTTNYCYVRMEIPARITRGQDTPGDQLTRHCHTLQ